MIQMRRRMCESVLREEEVPAKLFVFARNLNPVKDELYDGPDVIGNVTYYPDPPAHKTALDLQFSDADSEEQMLAALYAVIYEAECLWKPEALITMSRTPQIRSLLSQARFYPKGQLYVRRTDPYRYRIPDFCFDREGYLINQGAIDAIPYGIHSSRINGCGWVSAYNLMKLNGKEATMQETVEGLSRFGLGEINGENIVNLAFFLIRRNLPVRLTIGRSAIINRMKQAHSGILLYSVGWFHAHYVAWKRIDSRNCCFYNAVYGKSGYIMTPEEFFEQHVKGLNRTLLYIG